MKISWLGKLLLADAAIDVAKAVYDRTTRRDEEEEDEGEFSNVEVRYMAEAVQRDDYLGFKQIYRDRHPRSSVDRVNDAYEWFQARKRNGWT